MSLKDRPVGIFPQRSHLAHIYNHCRWQNKQKAGEQILYMGGGEDVQRNRGSSRLFDVTWLHCDVNEVNASISAECYTIQTQNMISGDSIGLANQHSGQHLLHYPQNGGWWSGAGVYGRGWSAPSSSFGQHVPSGSCHLASTSGKTLWWTLQQHDSSAGIHPVTSWGWDGGGGGGLMAGTLSGRWAGHGSMPRDGQGRPAGLHVTGGVHSTGEARPSRGVRGGSRPGGPAPPSAWAPPRWQAPAAALCGSGTPRFGVWLSEGGGVGCPGIPWYPTEVSSNGSPIGPHILFR